MSDTHQPTINVKWAAITFAVGYLALAAIGFISYFALAAAMHQSTTTFDVRSDAAYQLSQQLNVGYNLITWMLCAWWYFRRSAPLNPRRAWALGLFWLAIALPADLLLFVFMPSPGQLNFIDFYVGQFPWIYLVYLTAAISPVALLLLRHTPRKA